MAKKDLVEKMHETYENISKSTLSSIIDDVFSEITKTLIKEKKMLLVGFGTFVVRKRKARIGRNPQTGKSMKIKASKTVGFRPSKKLKEFI